MGILGKLFKVDKNEEDLIIAKEMDVEKEINTILLILHYLSIMQYIKTANLQIIW